MRAATAAFAALFGILSLVTTQSGATSTGEIQLFTVQDLADVITSPTTRAVNVTTFVLGRSSPVRRALETVCKRGLRANIMLDGRSLVRSRNDDVIAELNAAGCNARLADRPLHMKLAYVNNSVYLADTNFTTTGYVVRDDLPEDRNVITQTLRGNPTADGHFSTIKRSSLALEAATISGMGASVWFESESFGDRNPVYEALLSAALAHRQVRVMVTKTELSHDRHERLALERLREAGAEVRVTRETEKMAIGPAGAFVGSANATAGVQDQVDWGLFVVDAVIVRALAARYAKTWDRAYAL